MQRLLSTATLLGLLILTAAAFAITEKLKLEKSAIYGTLVSKTFSPTCGCPLDKAAISFKLRRRDHVTVTVLTTRRRPVRTVASAVPLDPGRRVFRWDGRTDTGERAPDGTYLVEVHLAAKHSTIVLPNRIVLDTTRPGIVATADRPVFSPDGDHQADSVVIDYTVTEPAHAVVYLGRRLVIRGRSRETGGSVVWYGKVDDHLHPPGTVTLSVGAVDLAGNATPVAKRSSIRVTLRYITLASRRITGVAAGRRFDVGVSTDATRYGWLLAGRHGFAHGPVLRLRAPAKPGRYRLLVTEHGHSDHAVVVVR